MKRSAVSSVFRKLVGAFHNYFMLLMSDNQACAPLKFLSPCLILYCKQVAATLYKDREDCTAAAATWFSDHDITLKWKKKSKTGKEMKRRGKKKENLSWAFAKFCLLVLSKSQWAFRTEWISPGAPYQQRELLPVKGFPVITCSLFYCQTIRAFLSFRLLDYGVFEKWIQ